MAAGLACRRFLRSTLQKSGFRGLFSPARRRNIPAPRITGENLARKFSGLSRRGCGPLPHALYLTFTCDIPRRGGAGQRADVPGRLRQAGQTAGTVTPGGRRRRGRRYMPGRWQVHARYTAGTCRVRDWPGARYIAGTRQVDRGWLDRASFPSRLDRLELPHG